MRTLLAALLLTISIFAEACLCYPPEHLAKYAKETIVAARSVVHARVVSVAISGVVKLQVLESFKGPQAGSLIEASQAQGHQCGSPQFAAGDEVLVTSFGGLPLTACDRYRPDPALVAAFRKAKAK
jgi:hypothetical protein